MVVTRNLNQAAMLMAVGGKLIKIIDKTYPQWEFLIKARPWQVWYEKHIGIVPYRLFCRKRVWLKEQYRRHEGKSGEFRGKRDGFMFNDVVKIVPFTKREREHLKL